VKLPKNENSLDPDPRPPDFIYQIEATAI